MSFDNFTDNSNGIITNNNTGLMWQKDEAGLKKFRYALSYCENLSLGGYSDWRLPNVKELESIINDTRYNPAINTSFFPGFTGWLLFWSSTTSKSDSAYAWFINFGTGYVADRMGGDFTGTKSESAHVRCVRGGKKSIDELGISVYPPDLAFGIVNTENFSTRDLTVLNTGIEDINIGTISAPPAPFSITSDACSNQILPLSTSCIVTVKFAPASKGVFTNELKILSYDGDNSVVTVKLGGSTGSFLPTVVHPFSYMLNGDGTVTDNNTGLIWQQTIDATQRIWTDAINYCDALNLGGYADWRLPTRKELFTLSPTDFPYTEPFWYNTWTSTTYAKDPAYAWYGEGDIGYSDYLAKSSIGYVRCVRGNQLIFNDFVNNANGTITDRATGLIWQAYSGGAYGIPLNTVSGLCNNSTTGGYSAWRLPNKRELISIVDDSRIYPAINTAAFPDGSNFSSYDYVFTWFDDHSNYVDFNVGDIGTYDLNMALGCDWGVYRCASYVRCVRDSGTLLDDLEIFVTPSKLTFTKAVGGSQTFGLTIKNIGAGNLVIGTIISPSPPFSITSDGCSGITLSGSATCPITVKFTPSAEGAFTDTLTIPSNDADYPNLNIKLNGTAALPSTMTGTVTDINTGQPLSDTTITVTDASNTTLLTTTDTNGAYTLSGLTQGSYTLKAVKTGYFDFTYYGLLNTQFYTYNVSMTPKPPLTITITSPSDGAVVHTSSVTVSGNLSHNATVTVNGVQAYVSYNFNTFSVSIPLSEGQNNIRATATDQYSQTASHSINVTLVASKGAISGTVTDSSAGLPIPSATVSVTDSLNNTQTALTGSDGKYTIANIASGTFSGSITKADYTAYNFSDTISAGQTITVNAALSPINLIISDINVSNITTDSALITWTTDQPSDSKVDYGETTAYGSSAANASMTTNHSIVLNNLSNAATYHYRVTSTNSYGLSSSSADDTFTTSSPITLTITSPLNDATINRPDVTVKGTITNANGNETGVTVNGIVATIYGNQFIANHVPLTEGSNIITVTATDTAGKTATTAITVNAVTTLPYITLNANVESGIAPMTAYFTVSTSIPNSAATYEMDYNGDGTIDYTGTTFDNISATYTIEGIYYPTVVVTDSQGITYTDTIAIVVLNQADLEALLNNI